MRKIAMWAGTGLYLILVLSFASKRFEGQLCNSLEVAIMDSVNTGFLIPADVENALAEAGIEYLGQPLQDIDLNEIEKTVLANQIVKSCTVYTSIDGKLHIDLMQRHPFVRIIDAKEDGYYLDHEGNVLNLSRRFSPLVLVVNGHIRSGFRAGEPVNVKQLGDDKWERKLREIYELSSFISGDEFWDAQIVQIYVNKTGEFELVPRVGPHIILLGDITDYKKKFKKLEVFYREGLPRVGWNQYIKINLKYKDQVVCTKI